MSSQEQASDTHSLFPGALAQKWVSAALNRQRATEENPHCSSQASTCTRTHTTHTAKQKTKPVTNNVHLMLNAKINGQKIAILSNFCPSYQSKCDFRVLFFKRQHMSECNWLIVSQNVSCDAPLQIKTWLGQSEMHYLKKLQLKSDFSSPFGNHVTGFMQYLPTSEANLLLVKQPYRN